jgi:hypothetical protein
MRRIHIEPAEQRVEAYRSLLRAPWCGESLAAAVQLIRDVLTDASFTLTFSWERPGRGPAAECGFEVGAAASALLRSFIEELRMEKEIGAQLPNRRKPELVELARQAEVGWCLLNVQYLARAGCGRVLEDRLGFLRDCQSVLYSLVITHLLPALTSAGMRREHDFMVAALQTHAVQVWSENLTHQAFLLGLVATWVGEVTRATEVLEFAFRTTFPEDHDYLTKAHKLWFHLLDTHQLTRAKEFVLALYRSAPAEHLPEVREMIEDTFAVSDRLSA